MPLRQYQQDAVDAIWGHFERWPGNPLVVMPTGSGKSHVIAEVCQQMVTRWPETRVLMLTHVRELIEQNAGKLWDLWKDAPLGIYSAGLNSREVRQITFAGVQSVYKRAAELGHIDLVVIDEAHRVPKKGLGMYRRILEGLREINPEVRALGLTATPYRLDGGLLHRGDGRLFDEICYEANTMTLVQEGWLCDLVSRAGGEDAQIQTQGVKIQAGEFNLAQLEDAALEGDRAERAAAQIAARAEQAQRTRWLIFCSGVRHAQRLLEALRKLGVLADLVVGETPSADRQRIVEAFRSGELTCLVNVGVFTHGFDVPQVDLLALLRPTASTSLYVQMMGRGMRTAEGKRNCLILDFGGNVMRHGPINAVRPRIKGQGQPTDRVMAKVCPNCEALIALACRTCPHCSYEYPEPELPELDEKPSDLAPLVEQEWLEVSLVTYRRHEKEGRPDSLRVNYCTAGGMWFSEWVCLEHEGYAGEKASRWWLERSGDSLAPFVTQALEKAQAGGLIEPTAILVNFTEKFPRIVSFRWPDPAELPPQKPADPADTDPIPF